MYEASKATQQRGAGLDLDVNGLFALQAISQDLYATVSSQATGRGKGLVLSKEGATIKTIDTEAVSATRRARFGRAPVLIGWFELVQSLKQHLPPDAVDIGKTFTKVAPHADGGVDIFFAGKFHNCCCC